MRKLGYDIYLVKVNVQLVLRSQPPRLFRGTESAGLVGSNGTDRQHLDIVKGHGLARDVFTEESLSKLSGQFNCLRSHCQIRIAPPQPSSSLRKLRGCAATDLGLNKAYRFFCEKHLDVHSDQHRCVQTLDLAKHF